MIPLNPVQQSTLKKLLPKGTCLLSQVKKHEYINKFLQDPMAYKFVVPMPAEFAPFVVIRIEPQKGNPIFQLFYHPKRRFLLAAQQQSMSIGCNYLISRSQTPSKSQNFVGKLRGNFKANEFQLYDNGDNPERIKTRPRNHLGFIKREETIGWKGGDKDLKILMMVPKPQESSYSSEGIHQYQPIQFTSSQSNINPLSNQSQKDSNVQVMLLRKGVSCEQYLCKLVLQSSIKSQSLVIKQKSKTFFQLQIGCPLTILQGFGFLLAAIENLSL